MVDFPVSLFAAGKLAYVRQSAFWSIFKMKMLCQPAA
jgi:hypothetical protein